MPSMSYCKFDDGKAKFEFKGDSMDVLTEFRSSGLYRYLRNNYNGSPPDGAVFRLVDTDNKTFVDYEIVTGVDGMEEGEGGSGQPETVQCGTVCAIEFLQGIEDTV